MNFFDFLLGQKLYLVGLGKCGMSAAKALNADNLEIKIWDDSHELRENLDENMKKQLLDPENCLAWHFDVLVVGPGVPVAYPKPHKAVTLARQASKPVWNDVELFFRAFLFLNDKENVRPKVVGITGSNGKSTTTALTNHILNSTGFCAQIGGNFGIPIFDSDRNFRRNSVLVLELSSNELELMETVMLDASVIMNVTPDHLDRHGCMENYVKAKKRIFEITKPSGCKIAVLNSSGSVGEYPEIFAEELKNLKTISTSSSADILVSENGILTDTQTGELLNLNSTQFSKLRGLHNWDNIAAAYCLVKVMNPKIELGGNFATAVATFTPLPHRQERIGTYKNAVFINDSKATNFEAAIPALRSFDNIFWILGGRSKSETVPLKSLEEFFPKILRCFVIGECKSEYHRQLIDFVSCEMSSDLDNALKSAVKWSLQFGNQEITVLLSPACASFDQYKNFEERGEHFRNLVTKIVSK